MGGEKVLSILQTLFKQFQHHLEGESDNNQIFFMNAIKSQQVLNNVWRDGQILSLHMNDPRLSKIKAAVSADHVDGKETGASKKIALKWPKTADVSALWTNTKNDSYPCTKHDTIFAQQKQDRDSRWNTITSQLANIFEEKPLDISALIAEGDSVLESFPLMLIRHRPSTNPLNLTDRCLPGFTLIVPEAWSRSVWDRFSHAGFLPVGLEEMHYMQQRHGVLSFPQDYPDTLAGRQYWKDNHTQHSSIQLKKPPSKRTKLTKYSNICDLFYGTTEEENAICFTVVRTLAYLTAFNLSESSLKLDQEQLESILNDINANKTSSSILEALPKLPNTTFVHLLINPTSRGLPRVGAIIYAMTTEDLKAYVKKHCKHKLALQGHVNFANDESKWQGIAFQGNDINREVLGVVTSGYVEHINAHKHEHNGKGGAISMSNVEDLHRYMRNQYELLSFPDAHKMVFFHNPGSQWLRPAKLYFM